ncbi:hypothetical protein QJS04_geneDACA017494 [Acorus gramineus]|uniref:Uncharacterized protein n=1 Tax=Acorus gramineus TaxID=55184 RepID=A0AAV9AI97_ACOGR|nr:hypothetical protein QJS04_geneDACA017494 [Acorus gramineus]
MKARKGRPTQTRCKLDEEGETISREQAMGTSEKKSSQPAPPDDGGRNHRTVYSVPDPIINSEVTHLELS